MFETPECCPYTNTQTPLILSAPAMMLRQSNFLLHCPTIYLRWRIWQCRPPGGSEACIRGRIRFIASIQARSTILRALRFIDVRMGVVYTFLLDVIFDPAIKIVCYIILSHRRDNRRCLKDEILETCRKNKWHSHQMCDNTDSQFDNEDRISSEVHS